MDGKDVYVTGPPGGPRPPVLHLARPCPPQSKACSDDVAGAVRRSMFDDEVRSWVVFCAECRGEIGGRRAEEAIASWNRRAGA